MLLGHDVNATALVYNRYCGCRYPRISTHFWRTEKTFILNFKPPSVSPHHWSTSLLHKLYRHPCSPYFTYYSFPPTKIGVVSILVELFVLPLGTQSEPIGHDWMTSDTPGGRGTSTRRRLASNYSTPSTRRRLASNYSTLGLYRQFAFRTFEMQREQRSLEWSLSLSLNTGSELKIT
jgi:hypothetical protein